MSALKNVHIMYSIRLLLRAALRVFSLVHGRDRKVKRFFSPATVSPAGTFLLPAGTFLLSEKLV